MKLIYLSLCWIAGIYLGSTTSTPWGAILAVLLSASIFAFLFRHKQALLLSALCLAVLCGGVLRFQATLYPVNGEILHFYNDKGFVEVKGVISADPEPKARSTTLRLEAQEIEVQGEWRKVSGATLVYVPQFPNDYAESRDFPYYCYGDLVRVKGNLETPPVLEDFDYREYLARKGIQSIIYYPKEIELVASGQGSSPLEWIYEVRGRMSGVLGKTLHEPQGSLAQAILLGKRSTLPAELKNDFVRSGIAHIVAISGLHISIVAGIILSLGVWIFGRHRPTYFLLALALVWVYTILTGWQPSAFRAAIMASLWLFADRIGRPNVAINSLLLAAAIMVGIHPQILGDVSFQLSFAAMAGLIFLTPKFQAWGGKALGGADFGNGQSGARFVINSLSVTLGAILFALPLIAFYFQRVSLVAPPASFFVLPAVPGIIVTAALTGGIGLLSLPLAQVLGWVAWLFTAYVIKVAQAFSALPFAAIDIEVSAPLVWGYYIILALALWLPANWKRLTENVPKLMPRLAAIPKASVKLPLKWVAPPLLIIAILVWSAAFAVPDNKLHVFFLDVGQGDAILIERGSQQILVDGGPSSDAIMTQLGKRLPFWDRTIELVVLTHPEMDHLTGLVEVLRRYQVRQILTSGQEHDSAIYEEWLKLIEEKCTKRTIAQAGQRIELGNEVGIEVLHPQATLLQDTGLDLNNNSVVLRLTSGGVSFLLTGDICEAGEECLLNRWVKLQSVVLKVAHHGSDTSTSSEFLAAVRPQLAVISVGAENPFGHPNPEVVDRLQGAVGEEGLYLTSEDGTIEFIIDGQRLWVRKEE